MTVALICVHYLSNTGYAQSIYRIQKTKEVDVKLRGTSTMHDWEMDALFTIGEAQFLLKSTNESKLISI